jgi:hypothetical protein
MIRIIAAASFALLAIPTHADGPLLVIDRWWGVDYAKTDCQIPAFKPAGKSEATCIQESTESYNVFELELKTLACSVGRMLRCYRVVIRRSTKSQATAARSVPTVLEFFD